MAYFESASSIIYRKLNQKQLKNAYLVGVIQTLVGKVGRVVSLQNKTVKIRVPNPISGYQLMGRQQTILDEICQKQGAGLVDKIHVVVER